MKKNIKNLKGIELTDETKVNRYGITLHRIRLTSDCRWGKKVLWEVG
jgi:hypothetical protein